MADIQGWLTELTRNYGWSLLLLLVAGVIWQALMISSRDHKDRRFRDQLLVAILLLLTAVGLVLTWPLTTDTRTQLLTLLGLMVTAVLTLSSPTIAANAMAGFMLRSLKKFSPGDFIQVDAYFGRVTEQGLFHTEIQTEDRDLLTLPNLYLSSHPIKVVHADGTVVSAEVTLGYDIDHKLIEAVLLQAAEDTGLEEPFVYVMELGDYSVNYRVAGFLKQVKHLLSARSQLRRKMMDRLHAEGIEIVSPRFVNQRQVPEEAIPERSFTAPSEAASGENAPSDPEKLIFDKAERAQQLQELQTKHQQLEQELEESSGEDKALKARKQRRLQAVERAISVLDDSADGGQ